MHVIIDSRNKQTLREGGNKMPKEYTIEFLTDNADNDFLDLELEVIKADSMKQAIEILEEKYYVEEIMSVFSK